MAKSNNPFDDIRKFHPDISTYKSQKIINFYPDLNLVVTANGEVLKIVGYLDFERDECGLEQACYVQIVNFSNTIKGLLYLESEDAKRPYFH